MLFISILLSVWFAIWLMYAVFIKDTAKLFVAWMNDMVNEDEDESIDPLLEKADKVFHLSCEHCGYTWWATTENVNYCPECGKKLHN